jgi:hypothetical protein
MLRSLFNGFVGATALTVAHQFLKSRLPDAPRMDVLGMRGLEKVCTALGMETPKGEDLFKNALVGDLVMNSLYYSQVGANPGFATVMKGVSLGLTAGVGSASLPNMLGMGKEATDATHKTNRTMALTVGLYLLGGVAAAMAAQCCKKK